MQNKYAEALVRLVNKIDGEAARGTPVSANPNCPWDADYPQELIAARELAHAWVLAESKRLDTELGVAHQRRRSGKRN